MSNIVKVVDGWQVEDRDGQATVLDVGLAEHADLRVPRDIRRTIAKAIEENALKPGVGGAHGADEACFWTETEIIPGFGGTSQEITVYRLNRAAALFIVTRLRTPKAVELTLAIVKVFDQVTSGRVLAVAPPADGRILEALASLAASFAVLAETQAMVVANQTTLAQSVDRLMSGASDVRSGNSFAATIGDKVRIYAEYQCDGTPRAMKVWRGRGHRFLRGLMGFHAPWPLLPAHRRPDAMIHMDELIRGAKQAAAANATRAQLTLVPQPQPEPKSGTTTTGAGGE